MNNPKRSEAEPRDGNDLENLAEPHKDSEFSFFNAPITNAFPARNINLFECYQLIKSDKYKNVTETLRATTDRTAYKTKNFDYVTFSGAFTKRANNSLIKHSEYFCIDIDHVGSRSDLSQLQAQIITIIEPVLIFVSPSGDGLKLVFKIDISTASHDQYFTAFQNFFRKELQTEIDKQCREVSRATFLCYDPECYHSEKPDVCGIDFVNKYVGSDPAPAKPEQSERITDPDEIIRRCNVWINKTQSFVDGNRNRYVSDLCGAFNRYGISESTALAYFLPYSEQGFTETEIRATVKSIYSNTTLHNTAYFETSTGQEIKPQATTEPEETTPLMPIDGFPKFIQDLINECVRVYGTHRDLWAAAFFSSTASAIGQSVILKTKYENPPLFWLAVVAASGLGKTNPFDIAFKLIQEIDFVQFQRHQQAMSEYTNSPPQKGQKKPEKPKQASQHIQTDITPEALAQSMGVTPRGISILRDELISWISDFGRYGKSGEESNALSMWSQSTYKVTRKNGENEFIKNPCANIFGGIQPAKLSELAKNGRADNGFLPRFCFVFPDKIQAPDYSKNELSGYYTEKYQTYIKNLLAIPGYREEIRLSPEAENLYSEFYNKNAYLNNTGKQPDFLNEVNAKLNVIVLRVAINFHFSKWACTGTEEFFINESTMKAAIHLTEYFRITAKKVYRIISTTGASDNRTLVKILHEKGNSQNEIANVLKISQQAVNKILKK